MTQQPLSLQNIRFFRYSRRQAIILMAAGLTGCINTAGNKTMTDTAKHFKSFVNYWSRINFWDGAIPKKESTSYPVPVLRKGQVQIAYIVCPYIYNQKGSWIWPPNKVAWFDPVSGDLLDEYSVAPDYFNQDDPVDKKFKKNLSIPSDRVDAFDNLRKRLFELYDVLFAAWAANHSSAGQGQLQNQARDFLRIFYQISKEPLKPYYEALGRDWFGWLRALAQ